MFHSHFSSASSALIFSKFGNCRASSLLSAVLNHAISIDDERRALGHAAHPEIHLRQE